MPRPALNDDQLAEARARILAAAGRIISAEGYGALSMRRVATAVGLTAGALYRYFPTKQDVLRTYCIEALDQLADECNRILLETDEALLALERILIAYGDFALDDPDRFRILFLDPQVTRLELDDPSVLNGYELLLDTVERVQSGGLLRPLPTADIARILLASVHGVCALSVTVREIDFSDARALAGEAVRNALRGLSSTPGDLT